MGAHKAQHLICRSLRRLSILGTLRSLQGLRKQNSQPASGKQQCILSYGKVDKEELNMSLHLGAPLSLHNASQARF